MTPSKKFVIAIMCCTLMPATMQCKDDKDVALQNPMLVVKVELLNMPVGKPDDANKLYLIYYNSSDWTEPWFVQSATSNEFFNPIVLSFSSMYLAVFYDTNGNTVVDAGEPCTGYNGADHMAGDSLTKIEFLPLEIKQINMTLDNTVGPFY
jgi:hypothetical protein